jgi:hypothetical protein
MKIVGKDEKAKLVAYTPEGYFKAPKNVMKDFHFVKGGTAFPLLSYEVFLNRPDLVLSSLNFAPEKTVELYKQAYLKRLERNGLTENLSILNVTIPTVEITNVIDAVINSTLLQLQLSFSEGVDTYQVFDNGVPIVTRKIAEAYRITEDVKLLAGMNTLSVIARTKEGVESDPVTVSLNCVAKTAIPKIHFIGIGVSAYEDATWNLNFADDDVRSLSAFFQNKNYFDAPVSIDTLINEAATKSNYLALKEKLLKTDVNDIVIISLSGHGLLDDEKNFFFATHDIDFRNPQEKGLSYDEIQGLLENIPARKKLLLIDACHSGEANATNKSLWTISNNEPVDKGHKGGAVENVGAADNLDEESFELMKASFQELDRGNGTFVISAAGAKEFAIESSGNGIFTNSIINSIADWQWNNRGQMHITDLQKDVYERVLKATNGQQKPTSRSENIEWDWEIGKN